MAVLATYADDDLTAVYRYFRSLCVRSPFLTARENLSVLFEKNRIKVAAFMPTILPNAKASSKRGRDRAKVCSMPPRVDLACFVPVNLFDCKALQKPNQRQVIPSTESQMEQLRLVLLVIVRLNGILFTRIGYVHSLSLSLSHYLTDLSLSLSLCLSVLMY